MRSFLKAHGEAIINHMSDTGRGPGGKRDKSRGRFAGTEGASAQSSNERELSRKAEMGTETRRKQLHLSSEGSQLS